MMREIQISRFRHKKTKCTNLCLFAKNFEIENVEHSQLIHMLKMQSKKVEKKRFSPQKTTEIIHIIHIKHMFSVDYFNKKERQFLVSYDKNAKYVEKNSINY